MDRRTLLKTGGLGFGGCATRPAVAATIPLAPI